MTKEQFEREKNYRVALSIAKAMLARGLINDKGYAKINAKLIAKYRPVFGGLCR
ncbi:MAG: SHOCT domain-containing protein [Clostridiaceae bacterium]|nr:hypothetical protein [Eubacteriales bacterium]